MLYRALSLLGLDFSPRYRVCGIMLPSDDPELQLSPKLKLSNRDVRDLRLQCQRLSKSNEELKTAADAGKIAVSQR